MNLRAQHATKARRPAFWVPNEGAASPLVPGLGWDDKLQGLLQGEIEW